VEETTYQRHCQRRKIVLGTGQYPEHQVQSRLPTNQSCWRVKGGAHESGTGVLPSGVQHDRYLSTPEGDVGIVKSILRVPDG